ncbi:MAG: Maf family protein [Anaerolineae bacterium]
MPPLILASTSPRRRELLALFEIPFTIRTANIDETRLPGEAPAALVQRLSREKALAVAEGLSEGVIVAADTVVVRGGRILGKPADPAEARQMLRRLRQGPHQVLSGLTVVDVASNRSLTRVNQTRVWMRPYTEAEIAAYVASGDPLDKAGAYGIQHQGFRPVARLEGCFVSVMGLPLGDLAEALAGFGVRVEAVGRRCAGYTGQACCR